MTATPDTSWFRGLGLGLFLHWGHASTRGWELSWQMTGGVPLGTPPNVDDRDSGPLEQRGNVGRRYLRDGAERPTGFGPGGNCILGECTGDSIETDRRHVAHGRVRAS